MSLGATGVSLRTARAVGDASPYSLNALPQNTVGDGVLDVPFSDDRRITTRRCPFPPG